MSYQEGKSASDALDVFNIKAAEHWGNLVRMGYMLQSPSTRLDADHFNEARTYLKELRTATKIKIYDAYEESKPKNEELDFFSMHMAFISVDDVCDSDEYNPSIHRTRITKNSILDSDRPLPMRIPSAHMLEQTHYEHEGFGIEYQSPEFVTTVAMCLAIIYSLDPMMKRRGVESMPLVLPFDTGAFIASVSKSEADDMYTPNSFLLSSNGEQKVKPFIVDSRYFEDQTWKPGFVLNLHSYAPLSALNHGQQYQLGILKSLFSGDRMSDAAQKLIDRYTMCDSPALDVDDTVAPAITYLTDRCKLVFSAPEWWQPAGLNPGKPAGRPYN